MDTKLHVNLCRKMLDQLKLDALFISSVSNIIYLTGYEGFSEEEREGYLLLSKRGTYIFTDARYTEAIKRLLPNITLKESTAKSPFLVNLEQVVNRLNLNAVGIEADDLRVSEYKKISPLFKQKQIINLRKLREKKDITELALLKKACHITDLTYAHILKRLDTNQSEKQIASEMEYVIKRQNAEISFRTIVASGPNSAIPHHLSSNKKLQNNSFLLFDFGARWMGYCADMSRTIIIGKANLKQKKLYQTVLEAQQIAEEAIQQLLDQYQAVYAEKVDSLVRQYISKQGYTPFSHALGHGIGVEVHELPYISQGAKSTLSEYKVFSLEPGIYLPQVGGVRIEDLYTIQNNRLLRLSKADKQELLEV